MAQQALDTTKTAHRNSQSLRGDNFYADKLAQLRADATSAYRQLVARSAGDSSALAELIESVFSATTARDRRREAARELTVALRMREDPAPPSTGDLIPLAILGQTGRGYLTTVGRQMNGSFEAGWFDACAVMMRRLLEISIIEAFEAHGIANKIKDANGDYVQLTDLVNAALRETSWNLSRVAKRSLPTLRDVGHQSAHGRYYHAEKEDIERIRNGCRIVIEEFLHHARLL